MLRAARGIGGPEEAGKPLHLGLDSRTHALHLRCGVWPMRLQVAADAPHGERRVRLSIDLVAKALHHPEHLELLMHVRLEARLDLVANALDGSLELCGPLQRLRVEARPDLVADVRMEAQSNLNCSCTCTPTLSPIFSPMPTMEVSSCAKRCCICASGRECAASALADPEPRDSQVLRPGSTRGVHRRAALAHGWNSAESALDAAERG